jgi:hypothetical protein
MTEKTKSCEDSFVIRYNLCDRPFSLDWTEAIQNRSLFVVDYDLKHEPPIHTLHLTLEGARRQVQEFIKNQNQVGEWTQIDKSLIWEHERGRDRIEINDACVGE